jgi:non-specific protein-tyrosine kinase
VDLRRQIAIVRAWFPLLVASVLLAAGAAFVVSSVQPKVYEAKATMIVGQLLTAVNPDYTQLLVSQSLSTTYAAVATKGPTLDAVIQQLGLGVTSTELSRQVHVDAPVGSTLLTITAQDVDPSRAAAIANALAQQLIATSPGLQGRQAEFQASIDADLKATQDQIDAIQAQIVTLSGLPERTAKQDADLQTLDGRLVSLRSAYATLLPFISSNSSSNLTVVEPATPPINPTSPRPLIDTLLGAVFGLVVAAGVVAVAERLDDGIRDSDAVLDATGLSTLGAIFRMKGDQARSEIYRLATLLRPRSGVSEAYRALRANIEFASVDAPLRTLLVTSSVPGEGKTVTAANLATVFAQAGRRVLLVDADLRKPGVHALFDLPNAHGLTTLLRSDEADLDAIAHPTEQANLRVITTGPLPPNPAELMGSQRMRTVLERLKASADLVVFDSPPLQAVTDSAILSSFLDGTLFVIDAGHGRRRAVRPAREALARAGANVLGVALNRIPARADSDYASYYGGYHESDQAAKPPARLPDASPESPAPSAHLPGTS